MEDASFTSTNGNTLLSLSPDFILPQDKRPLLSKVSPLTTIPIINMDEDDPKKLSQACEEYGCFQIINHGISEELCNRMMVAVAQLLNLPLEEKKELYTEDRTKDARIFNFNLNVEGQGKIKMWSETFSYHWHPVNDFTHILPNKPPHLREVAAEYAKEIGGLLNRILGLLSQGLGLDKDLLQKRLGDNTRFVTHANSYPPCPDPELTLGLVAHSDFNALTIVQQSTGVSGLQFLKDGKWITVDPFPNAFVVNLGDQIQVLSNGRYRSACHRAVTNKELHRVSLAMFYAPNTDTILGPIEELIDEEHPPLYRKYRYAEFLAEFLNHQETGWRVKEVFKLHN